MDSESCERNATGPAGFETYGGENRVAEVVAEGGVVFRYCRSGPTTVFRGARIALGLSWGRAPSAVRGIQLAEMIHVGTVPVPYVSHVPRHFGTPDVPEAAVLGGQRKPELLSGRQVGESVPAPREITDPNVRVEPRHAVDAELATWSSEGDVSPPFIRRRASVGVTARRTPSGLVFRHAADHSRYPNHDSARIPHDRTLTNEWTDDTLELPADAPPNGRQLPRTGPSGHARRPGGRRPTNLAAAKPRSRIPGWSLQPTWRADTPTAGRSLRGRAR